MSPHLRSEIAFFFFFWQIPKLAFICSIEELNGTISKEDLNRERLTIRAMSMKLNETRKVRTLVNHRIFLFCNANWLAKRSSYFQPCLCLFVCVPVESDQSDVRGVKQYGSGGLWVNLNRTGRMEVPSTDGLHRWTNQCLLGPAAELVTNTNHKLISF